MALLPSDPRDQARLYQTASNALYQAATFCDRNQATCAQAQVYWGVFKEKAAIGARMAGDLISERMAADRRDIIPAAKVEPLPASMQPRSLERDSGDWRQRVRSQL
ncbi:MAG: DUF5330 domain-containing protein [Proteobacteria bacterium]|nr:DUF5330 domain-containing protein [Pseudomonadota bacterium]